MLSRRSFLSHSPAVLGLTLPSGLALAAPSAKPLTVYGPPVGPSVALANMSPLQIKGQPQVPVTFQMYKSPDVLRAGFLKRGWQAAVTPSYVAANLANRGLPVHLLNIMTSGMLYLLSYDETISQPEDLSGERVGMFFRNDMPDLLFNEIMASAKMKSGKEYQLQYTGTPFEAIQLLLSGRVRHCVLPEPAATAAMIKAKKMGKKLHRVMDFRQWWGRVTGGPARFPMAGLMVHRDLVEKHPDWIDALHSSCQQATDWVISNPKEAADKAAKHMPLGKGIIERSIPHAHLINVRAKTMQEEINAFYDVLKRQNPAIVGGKLPGDDFYL